MPKRIAIDRQGRITDERPLRQILTSWDRLQRLLRATIDPAHYHLGWAFERVEQNGSGVRVHFNGGRVEKADILIGGDGIRSTVRGQVAPELQPNYAGYYIWRGAPNEADLSPKTLKEIFPYFVFYLPPRQEVITYPIAGFNDDLRPGHRRYNFIWYRVADAAQASRDECRRERHAARILGAAAADPQGPDCADVRRRARDHAGGDARLRDDDEAAVHHADLRFHRAEHRVRPRRHGRRCRRQRRARTWASAWPRPAATPRRWRARSANHDDIDTALKAYNAERQPIGNTIVMHSRKLGTHMGVNLKTEEDRRMHALLQNDGAMMDWIAVPNFLDAYK